jgi:hypothetical protein
MLLVLHSSLIISAADVGGSRHAKIEGAFSVRRMRACGVRRMRLRIARGFATLAHMNVELILRMMRYHDTRE